jgi:hypothetical protein
MRASESSFAGCTFSGDTASECGGAVAEYAAYSLVVACNFEGEAADLGGGAIENIESSPLIVDSVFENNEVTIAGDGSIDGSGNGGGAIYNFKYATPIIVNCDFFNNTVASPDTGGAILGSYSSPATIANSILWNDSGGEIAALDSGSDSVVTYSDVDGGASGTGNINSDPLYVNPTSGGIDGFELQSNSPCINAGSDAALPFWLTTDDGGNARVVDGTVDMGAFEYQ